MKVQSGRTLLVLALGTLFSTPMRGQMAPCDPATCTAALSAGPQEKNAEPAKTAAPADSGPREKMGREGNSLRLPLAKSLLLDQKAIWTSPGQLRLSDATWLLPLGGLTAALLATDRTTSLHLSGSPSTLKHYQDVSSFGTASLVGAAGGLYLWGHITRNDHKRETGLLSGEALIDSLAASTALGLLAGRERPLSGDRSGHFWQDGKSFPSNQAAAAWSVASVIAHEYPGPLTKLLAYGLASAVSASRVTGKEHFPSDVLLGSAIGWFIGQHVYRAHHDPELGGGSWESPSEAIGGESPRKPGNMGSPYVPLDSWVYTALERLAAWGYVSTAFLGMRPWTRLECARLVEEAGERFREEAEDPEEPSRLYRTLKREFATERNLLGGGSNLRLRLESVYTRSTGIAGKPLRDGFHFGQTIINDFGRPYEEGLNNATGFSGWGSAGPLLAYARVEYQHAPSAPALPESARREISRADSEFPGAGLVSVPVAPATPIASVNRFRLLDAYVGMSLENFQITFGKQSLWWGPGLGGPMLFSDNAEPVNMLRINRIRPLGLPGIFGRLGPMRMEFFLGQLDGHHFVQGPSPGVSGSYDRLLNPQPFIHGQKISFKPTPNLEFALSRTTIFAGYGVPFTAHKFLQSLLSTHAGTGPPGGSSDPGARHSGMDLTYRLPKLRNWATFYADGFAHDEITPFANIGNRTTWQMGIYMPRIPRLPKFDFRAEHVYTDLPRGGDVCCGFFYIEDHFLGGYTNDGNLMGSWIGRAGQGHRAWLTYWLSPQSSVRFTYRHQQVSPQFIRGGGTLNDGGVQAELWLRPDLSVSAFVQYEKWNFPVLAPQAQSNLTTSFQLAFWPSHWGR